MIINKTQKKSKKIIRLTLLVVALCGIIAVVFIFLSNRNDSSSKTSSIDKINLESPTDPQYKDGEAAKESAINKSDEKVTPPVPGAGSSPVSISGAEYNARENGLVINTRIDNVATWSKCTLTLKKNDLSVLDEARVVYQDDASFCGGFFVQKDKLESGVWSVQISVSEIGGRNYEAQTSVTIP